MHKTNLYTRALPVVAALVLFAAQAGTVLADPPTGKGPPPWAGKGRPGAQVGLKGDEEPPPWAGVGRGAQQAAQARGNARPLDERLNGGGKGPTIADAEERAEVLAAFFEAHGLCLGTFWDALLAFHTGRMELIVELISVATSDAPDKEDQLAALQAELAELEAEKDEAEADKDDCLAAAEADKDAALAELEAEEEEEEED